MESPESGRAVSDEANASAPPMPARKAESLVLRLGALRDGLLLLAGILYLLGYASWAFYALENGIGLVPVLDAQYFAAGIVPAAILALFLLSVRLLRAFRSWLNRPLPKKYLWLPKAAGICGLVLMLAFVVLSLIVRQSGPAWVSWLPFGFLFFMLLAAFLGRSEGDRFMQRLGLGLIWCYTVLGALWLLLGYHGKVFPELASELGGPSPRCARLDLDGSQLSPETQERLLGATTNMVTQGVVRSLPVFLVFDGSEYLLLAEQPGKLSRSNRVYRLRKDAVKAVFPCPSAK